LGGVALGAVMTLGQLVDVSRQQCPLWIGIRERAG
jgi:hypothetical protein